MATYKVISSNRPNKQGLIRIFIRVTHKRNQRRVSTPFTLLERDFNPFGSYGKWVRSSEPKHQVYNTALKQQLGDLEVVESRIKLTNTDYSVDEIVNHYLNPPKEKVYLFTDIFQEQIEGYRDKGKFRTAKKWGVILGHIHNFQKGKPLPVDKADLRWFTSFENYLHREGLSINTIHGYLKAIRTCFRQAETMRISGVDTTIKNVRLKTSTNYKEKLDPEEVIQLQELDLHSSPKKEIIRDAWLFAFYAYGMRFSDLATLRWENIEGNKIRYTMQKTGKEFSQILPPDALTLLEKYMPENHRPKAMIFPILRSGFDKLSKEEQLRKISSVNASGNKILKAIAAQAGIEKNLSFHIARHSFAYSGFMRVKDVRIMQQTLKHTSLSETQTYLSSLDPDVDEELMRSLYGK